MLNCIACWNFCELPKERGMNAAIRRDCGNLQSPRESTDGGNSPRSTALAFRAPKGLKLGLERRPVGPVLCLFDAHLGIQRFA